MNTMRFAALGWHQDIAAHYDAWCTMGRLPQCCPQLYRVHSKLFCNFVLYSKGLAGPYQCFKIKGILTLWTLSSLFICSMKSGDHVRNSYVHFYRDGLGGHNGVNQLGYTVKTLEFQMKTHGDEGVRFGLPYLWLSLHFTWILNVPSETPIHAIAENIGLFEDWYRIRWMGCCGADDQGWYSAESEAAGYWSALQSYLFTRWPYHSCRLPQALDHPEANWRSWISEMEESRQPMEFWMEQIIWNICHLLLRACICQHELPDAGGVSDFGMTEFCD